LKIHYTADTLDKQLHGVVKYHEQKWISTGNRALSVHIFLHNAAGAAKVRQEGP